MRTHLYYRIWLLSIYLLASSFSAFAQIQPKEGPLNPEYLKYLEMVKQSPLPPSQDSLWLGAIPEPILPNFDAYYQTKPRAPQAFPTRFDLREEGRVTSVKNQGACGSCWIFGTYGALESNLLTLGFGALDLSEDNVMHCGTRPNGCDGGWVSTVVAYLATGDGPVNEADDPYTARSDGDCPIKLSSPTYVTDARYLPPDADLIKQTITDVGGIAITMPWGWSNYRSTDYTYFGSAIDGYHAVTIVGWDDNKPTKGGNGVWIAKNSWGRFWGEEGYFYIAYQQSGLSVYSFFENGVKREPGSKVYYYDKAGANQHWGFGQESAYGLTKYEANFDQTITKIGTFVNSANGSLDIEIYDEFNDILLGGIYDQNYTLPGYYTFDLPELVNVDAGDDFYIKVKYQTPQYNYPIPTDNKAPIETNNCWISYNGESWVAFGTGTPYPADLTIKAYAVPQSESLEIESLTLVNAETDQDIQELKDKDIIALSSTGNIHFSVRANTLPETVNRVEFELTGPRSQSQRERLLPYALFGDDMQGNYFGKLFPTGQYNLTVTPFSRTQRGTPLSISFQVVDELRVESLTLVNAETNQDIQELQDGDVINLTETGNIPFSVRANTSPEMVNFVRFELSGPTIAHAQREGRLPYALYGDDTQGNYFGQRWGTGSYTLTVTPFSRNQRGQVLTTNFEVVWSSSSSSPVAFQVYPVPTKGEVHVVHDLQAVQLQVLDRVGNVLLSQPASSPTEEVIDLQTFGQGTYYLKLISAKAVETKRVVVE